MRSYAAAQPPLEPAEADVDAADGQPRLPLLRQPERQLERPQVVGAVERQALLVAVLLVAVLLVRLLLQDPQPAAGAERQQLPVEPPPGEPQLRRPEMVAGDGVAPQPQLQAPPPEPQR